MADDLRELIDVARRAMPDVPAEVWDRFARVAREHAGGSRIYVAAQKKGRNLAILEASGEQDANKISQMLGVSVGYARRLKKLR